MAKSKTSWNLSDLPNTVNCTNMNEIDDHGYAPIHYAAGVGDLELIKNLHSLGVNLDVYTTISSSESCSVPPIAISIACGKVEALDLLLKLGADSRLKVDDLGMWTYAMRHKTLAPELISVMIVNGTDVDFLKGIINVLGKEMLIKLQVQETLVDRLIYAVNGGGAQEILDKYLTTLVDFDMDFDSREVSNNQVSVEMNADVEVGGEVVPDLSDNF